MIRAVLEAGAFLVLLGVCLFASAGRLAWPAAWLLLALAAAFTLASFGVVQADLLRERAAPGPGWDRVDALLAGLGSLGLYPGALVVAGLDAGRSGPGVAPLGQAVAFAVFTLGYGFALWAMRVNRFFSTFVRIQDDREHRVVSAGPYAWVRHPGYAGMLAAHLAIPVCLGSTWAFAPVSIGALLFVVRTAREDRVLSQRLPGYREYQARVRWRLVPGIW